MAYLTKETVLEAYKILSGIDIEKQQGLTQKVSALKYASALDSFYKAYATNCDLKETENRDKYSLLVGNVVKINDDYCTKDFFKSTSRNGRDYDCGSNFFSQSSVKDSKLDPVSTFAYPKRSGWKPVMDVRNQVLIYRPDYLRDAFSYYLVQPDHKLAYIVWLLRFSEINQEDIDGLIAALRNYYTDDFCNALLTEGVRELDGSYISYATNMCQLEVDDIVSLYDRDVNITTNTTTDITTNYKLPLQQIFYGAPGTGKSHKVNEITSQMPKENVFRTTFHPDSDYSTFVGAYKPIEVESPVTHVVWDSMVNIAKSFPVVDQSDHPVLEKKITYEFVPQVFTCAYVAAWNKLIPASGTGTTHSVPVSPSMPASDNSSPFGDCSLADPLREDFKYDLDGYTVSPLISKDEDLLKQIDSLQFPFEGYGCLGELHDVTTVVLSNQTPVSKIQKNRKDLQKMIANARTGNKDFGILGQNAYAQVVNEDFGILGQLFDLKGIIKQKLEDSKGELIDFEYSLLGEYRDGKVYLYVEAIRSVAGLSFEELLAAVYVHEMMHAYFKTSEVVTEVEEAIVECCTLSFLDRFDAATGNEHYLNSSYKYDLERKVFVGLGHYAFGAYLYEHQSLNWMDMYKGVRVNRSAASGYVDQFAQIYPFGEEEETMRMLYGLLNGGIASVTAEGHDSSMEDRVALVIEEINRGNCAQIFGDIFQLLDRDKSGYSEYPILADKDLAEYLMYAKDKNGEDILKNKKGIEGGKLCLPPNLSILATMNTSDQSLFPIDSAFKRRWDWIYMPIDTKKEIWKINVGKGYGWSSFLEKVNSEIEDTTSSEDKMLGFYFCKADGGVVSKETFVGKVLFYIYNDVFKDYDHNRDFFIDKDTSKKIRFKDFYKMDGTINEPVVEKLLENLTVESFEPEKGESGETE